MARSILIPAALGCLLSFGATARTLEVGAGKEFAELSTAAKAAREGDRVLIQPGEYFDCATWSANKITVEGVGDAEKVLITDKTCGGKALFITTGADITIRNLTLTRARVPDGNGAGIRSEGMGLTVDHVRFINNQNGILAGGPAGGTILVRNSEFVRNGVCEAACSHAIYVGNLASLRVEGSTFRDTRQGHHIKSRAQRTEVLNSTIEDGPTGTASYMIETPNGGSLIVRGNTITKGAQAENHSGAIVIGAEGVTQPTREITIEGNKFKNEGGYPTFFVVNKTATEAMLRGNTVTGNAKPLSGDGEVSAR